MESDEEKDELRKQNEDLRQRLQEYKALEEDLMATRIFQKAKKQFSVYITVGGVIIVLSAIFGIKALSDYAKNLAKEKIDAIAKDEIQKSLEAEGKRQITGFIAQKQNEIMAFAQQEMARVIVATQPIGQSQGAEPRAATVAVIDYTDQMLPVRDLGTEGNSVGFAVAAALEYQIAKTSGKRVTISPRYIYYYARLKSGTVKSDVGCRIRDAVIVLLESGGVSEASWPYKPGEFAAKPPKNIEQVEHFKITRIQPVRNVKELKAALQEFGPVAGGFAVYESIYGKDVEKTGRIPMPGQKESLRGATAVCFVGFNDNNRLIKFRNQWGSGWGDKGYGYMSYEFLEKFSLDVWAISMR